MDQTEKAFEFASSLVTQLITLSTAIITVTAVFTPLIMPMLKGKKHPSLVWLIVAWIFYLISIMFGVSALMGLTGQLANPPDGIVTAKGVYADTVRVSAAVEIILFCFATILVMVYFGIAIWRTGSDSANAAFTSPVPQSPEGKPEVAPDTLAGKSGQSVRRPVPTHG